METESGHFHCTAQFYSEYGHNEKKGRDNLWKTCIWTRDLDKATCTIIATDDWKMGVEQCDSSLGDVKLSGGNRHDCHIVLPNLTSNDGGKWTCKMEKCNEEGCKHKDSGICSGVDTVDVTVIIYYKTKYSTCFRIKIN